MEVTEWVEVAALQRGDGGEKLGIKISESAALPQINLLFLLE